MSIFGAIICVCGFVFAFFNAYKLKKTNNNENGFVWSVITLVTLLCASSFVAGIVSIIRIPIYPITVGIIYLGLGGLCFCINRIQGEAQKYYWEKIDLVYIGVSVVAVSLLFYVYFSPMISINYSNSDAAVHLMNARSVMKDGILHNQYFLSFHLSTVESICLSFLPEIMITNVYIIMDMVFLLIEGLFFIALIREYLNSMPKQIIGGIVVALYCAGYPLFGFLYSYGWVNLAVTVVGLSLFYLRCLSNNTYNERIIYTGLMLSCGAIPITYFLIGPVTFVAVFLCLIIHFKRNGRVIIKSNILKVLYVFAIPTLVAIYYGYFDFLRNSEMSFQSIMELQGGTYNQLYVDFLWVMPFVLYILIKQIRERRISETSVFFYTFLAVILVLGVLIYMKTFGGIYYFYKYYPVVWMLCFVFVEQAIGMLWDDSKEIVLSGAVLFVFLATMCWGKIEQRIVASETHLQDTVESDNFFKLYKYNVYLFKSRGTKYTPEMLEICENVINLECDTDIPQLATLNEYCTCYWYDAITGQDGSMYYGWNNTVSEIREKLKSGKTDYFVLFYNTSMYDEMKQYLSEYDIEFQNEAGCIYRIKK